MDVSVRRWDPGTGSDSQKNGDNFYWNGQFDQNTKRITWTREPGPLPDLGDE